MYKQRALLSELLNNYIGQEHQYGLNDCNILIAEYLDLLFETDYKQKLQHQYTDIKSGIKLAKSLVGFSTVLEACEKHLKKSNDIKTGSVLVKKHKLSKSTYYTSTIVFDNQALVEYQNKYTLTNSSEVEFDFIFNKD